MLLDNDHINLFVLCSDPCALMSFPHYLDQQIVPTPTPMSLDLQSQCFCLDSSAECA